MLYVLPASTIVKISVAVANVADVINSLVELASASSTNEARSTVVVPPSSREIVSVVDDSVAGFSC